ncbi:MAG: PAS domain S-box protein [Nitrospiraceae bacterium]|nr:MAG: PAS domain S-box protein [Nitrospiraceae bacterium]
MSLKKKLFALLSAFVMLIGILAVGTLIIFDKISSNVSILYQASGEQRLFVELENNLSSFLEVPRNWGYTGNQRFRRQYHERLPEVYKSFGEINEILGKTEEGEIIGEEFQELLDYAKIVIYKTYPVGDPDVRNKIEKIDEKGRKILAIIGKMHMASLDASSLIAQEGHDLKRNMIFYLFLLTIFSILASLYLMLSIRRIITEPFSQIQKAAEKVSKRELSYRINSRRTDEYGVVADRFDNMIEELEASDRQIARKLNETELLLEVAKSAVTTIDLQHALRFIIQTVSEKLHYHSNAIYTLRPEKSMYCLGASDSSDNTNKEECVPITDGILKKIMDTRDYVVIEDTARYQIKDSPLTRNFGSLFAAPIIHNNNCIAFFVVRNKHPYVYTDDDLSTLKILAHTINSVVRNAKLFQSTKRQLHKLTVLYELSSAVTSVLDLEELLRRIAEQIARLLSSKGCIIRLLEKDKLKIKSFYGLPEGVKEEMELSLGQGIAGFVAEKGEPLLVEDVSAMPAHLRVPAIEVQTVICVPLKVGESVIGTLGLYDKYNNRGDIISFSEEDLNTAEGFASISAIAIEKSKLYEDEVARKQKASEDRKRLDILFSSVQGGIITLDRNFNVISANRYIEDWIGLYDEDLMGKNALDIFHEKIGICPHCAAKPTFETGEINSIMQSRGVNYAELTAYPIKNEQGEIAECVVFIMDITERVLYQEETLSLYREVIQTKEYMESIIDNSADAIVTSDMEGTITSWNKGAENIYGYSESEAVGTFLPFVPESLMTKEKDNISRIKKGESIRNVETFRKKKDGTIIEVSLTLSPIKDAAGNIIGITGISRDISEKKIVEKELIRRNQELSRLFFISAAMRSTLQLDRLLRMVLTVVTMSDGLGFNRALLFLVDEEKKILKGAMGVGPENPEDAWKIWDEISTEQKTLDAIIQEIIATPVNKDSFFDRMAISIEIGLEEDTILSKAVKEKRAFNIKGKNDGLLVDPILLQQLGAEAYAIVPLISRDRVIGLLWADNYFNKKPITDEDMKFLTSFSNQIASSIENARLFEKVALAEQQLENIFESISDMVYFNSKDYVIRSVNKAVINKVGLPASKIIGRKCYEVFHGTDEPLKSCPHHKTVDTKKAYVEELDDLHMGGTFLTSSSPLFDQSGEFMGSVHVVRDISELKNLREKLTSAEKMAALGEVAAKVAHEIRNPLVSVGGFAKRLDRKLDGNLKEYAEIIVKEVDRLENILKEILGFVKETRLYKETIDINSIIEDVITLMKSDIEDRNLNIHKDLRSQKTIFVDPHRVKDAIVNIISNAAQSMVGSGSISIKTYDTKDAVVLEIEDTGRGIPTSDLPFIFNPFFTTKSAGTGLGLAITRRIIQEHDGHIDVQSEVDRGSIFKIVIPYQ